MKHRHFIWFIVAGLFTGGLTNAAISSFQTTGTFEGTITLDEFPSTTVMMGSVLLDASQYKTSGSGTLNDPYVDSIRNCYDQMDGTSNEIVYLSSGYYEESEIIVGRDEGKPRHLYILGSGFWDSFIYLKEDSNSPLFTVIDDAAIIIEKVSLNGNGDQQTEPHPLVFLKQVHDVVLRDVFILSSRGDGVQIGDTGFGAWAIDIDNCPIEYNMGNGITIINSNNVVISGCTLTANEGYQVELGGGGYGSYGRATIVDNHIGYRNTHAVKLGSKACSSIIADNRFVGFPNTDSYGIFFDGHSYNNEITGNLFDNGNGFLFTDYTIRSTIISDNHLAKCTIPTSYPIRLLNDCLLTDNLGLNPIGKYSFPFVDSSQDFISMWSTNDDKPSPNQIYEITPTSAYIKSLGGSNVNITIYDPQGNVYMECGNTFVGLVEYKYKIGWGGFTSYPTVEVFFT